jgi:periplasmic divalent cation tolerance protein
MGEKLNQTDFVIVFCTASPDESERIAKTLIEGGLAACVNVSPVRSYYRWEGELCDDEEDLLVIKTEKSMIGKIIERIKEIHSYDLPEIIAIPITDGYEKYLEWVAKSLL